MRFNYQARTKEGKIQVGVVEASSKEAALTLLQKHGLYVTLLEEVKAEPFWAKKIRIFERITERDIAIFSRQLAIMFNSRVPLVEALETLSRQTPKLNFREIILKLAEEVEGGTSFSQALSRYPNVFSPFFISMVKSGEISGKLSESLSYLANHLERDLILRSKIKGAMIYPAFVLSVFLIVGALLIFFIIPSLAQVLRENLEELPLITQITLSVCFFLKTKGWIIILVLLFFLFGFWFYLKTKEGRERWDKFFLKLPYIGDLFKKMYLARFAENLSTLISGGLSISQALEITAEVVGNSVYKKIILLTRDEVGRGEPMSVVFNRYPEHIPPLMTQMVLVGERTGRLVDSLMSVVSFYHEEINRRVENIMNLLEPLLIIFLGGLVGGLIFSVFIPLYKMVGTF